MISFLVSSREKNRKNPGDLNNLISSMKKSIYNVENIEVIFKFDNDDDIIEEHLLQAAYNNPDVNIKYFFSDRYGYLGLHKAYYECMKHLDPKSYIIAPLADDFLFQPDSHWDKTLLDLTKGMENKPFIVQDSTKVGKMHDIPVFSKKIIELITLGNSLSVDGLLVDICNIYLENNLNNHIITLPEFTFRQTCDYDWGHERWNIEREKLIEYLNSQEYKEFLLGCRKKIKQYFNLQ
jgi:hypothetical protein